MLKREIENLIIIRILEESNLDGRDQCSYKKNAKDEFVIAKYGFFKKIGNFKKWHSGQN